jgi:ribonucleoside-diphosphate reductase alpha chain
MFLDNTACNLASLNVLKFYDSGKRVFDVAAFEHGVDLWTMVLEISVLMAAFPSKEIAELSWKYRTLGLGYANLGAMLMQAGLAYDSDESRAVCACLTSILTGRSYRMSAMMAREQGPFPGYEADRENMLRVIRNHRFAAHGAGRASDRYESLKITPVPIDHAIVKGGSIPLNAGELLTRATLAWDEALELGLQFGYRNAQTTVIAPTGTIGLLMDCDTTGVEPDFALVKFKKLAGGGYFKIANESVRPALKALGYADAQIKDIMTFILGTLSLDVPIPGPGGTGAPPVQSPSLLSFLKSKGLPDSAIDSVSASLPGVFELSFAFSAWSIPADALKACGIDPARASADPTFNLLKALGLSAQQIDALNTTVCGTSTIEGAPHLRPEHLPVFDCANKCGKFGKRYIAAEGHIRMMAAAQPFISGAISKTINLPNEASVEDIQRCYRFSWELGLKANALYRDGCKLSQPLSSTSDEAKKEAGKEDAARLEEAQEQAAGKAGAPTPATSRTAASAPAVAAATEPRVTTLPPVPPAPKRRRLPDTRRSLTHKFNIAGHEGYLTVGLYDDGKPGELFITMSKEGSTIGGVMDSLGTATSVALQYGVPIESLVTKFSHQRFEPSGMTENSEIPFAKSLVDYIFRWMGMQFIAGYREANAPARPNMKADMKAEPKPDTRHASLPHAPHASRIVEASNRASELVMQVHTEKTVTDVAMSTKVVVKTNALTDALAEAQTDAPACDVCGNVTVRSGTCYKCLNCGNSMGCS